MSVDFDVKLDSMYAHLHDKFETLNHHVKKLDSQIAHDAGFVRREEGYHLGKTDTNPRRHVSDVLLRSGKQLAPNARAKTSSEGSTETREINKPLQNPVLLYNTRPKLSQNKDRTKNPQETEKVMIDFEDEEKTSEETIDRSM
ncbi:hypothetical protein Bca4012_065540 [Brassica carinata]